MRKFTPAQGCLARACALVALLGPSQVRAQAAFGPALNEPTPALAQFATAYSSVRDYTTSATVFERLNDGSRVESRTYAFKVLVPSAASATIVAGPGAGVVTAWHGGGTVTTHEAGPLAAIKLTVAIDDPRVQTLRGDTVDTGTFTYDLQYMLATPGTLGESAGPTIAGTATRAVTLQVKDPAVAAVTKAVLDVSTASHLPLRRQLYVGATIVKTETFADTKTNVGLALADLDG
jgi:outer membrane lipoprotein-sorting protein